MFRNARKQAKSERFRTFPTKSLEFVTENGLVVRGLIYHILQFLCPQCEYLLLRNTSMQNLNLINSNFQFLDKRFLLSYIILIKKWSTLGVRLSSYGCAREVGRTREKRLSGTRRSRLECSPNFPSASITQ